MPWPFAKLPTFSTMKYQFEITETLQKKVEIEAIDECEAKKTIEKQYRYGQVVLDAEDYKKTQIELLK